MKTLMARSATKGSAIVWAALVIFTVISFLLGGEHLIDNKTLAAAIVVGIAAIKIRLVGLHFMELKGAPVALRAAFEGYCVVLFVALMGIYVFA
ncbi:cytochrome C oxidase subunit IV family protein [Sporichthya sp.]|uniref:cytochrome C oxidase subunit IV family protein n=1 Tax=Sporichthya sp. TaxID=65475 RepID=UPI0017C831E7|nr:cytochrome C oxidase subunit IV family protein [Sporichthya sp.]MBA3744365.1 cytochrome C oxidase subunit IV family protein [Sporichthya sp.]